MAAPTISSTTPTQSETAVFLNPDITVTFDQDVDSSSISSATVILKSLAFDEVVDAQLTVDGATISVVPYQLLINNSSYTLTLIGADLALNTGAIGNASDEDLADTYTLTFQTGDQLNTPDLGHDSEEITRQGDASLPTDVAITNTDFSVVDCTPYNHTFGVDVTSTNFTIDFSSDIDDSTVAIDSTVLIEQYPFLDEVGFQAVKDDDDEYVFEQDDTDEEWDYSELDLTVTVVGDQLQFTTSEDREWPANTVVEVCLKSSIADTDGNTLGSDQTYKFYTDPFPMMVSTRMIRNELGTLMPDSYLDDYIGLRSWTRAIEAWETLGRRIDFNDFVRNRPFKTYIRNKVALDLIEDIRGENDINSGISKTLGDFSMSFSGRGTNASSAKERSLKGQSEAAWETMLRYWSQPSVSVKGAGDVVTMGSRQWRAPFPNNFNRNVFVSDPIPASNTSRERGSKQIGYWDTE